MNILWLIVAIWVGLSVVVSLYLVGMLRRTSKDASRQRKQRQIPQHTNGQAA